MADADMFSPDMLSHDMFLGGALRIRQPRHGYRAGVDPVLLAAFVRARAGQSVLELGCGAGVALLCLGHRVPGLRLTGIERQPAYAALARQNAEENAIMVDVHTADLRALPPEVRAISFDHVMANPPYFQPEKGTGAADGGRRQARAGSTPLEAWVDAATRRLKPGGDAHFILQAARLDEMLRAMDGRLGDRTILPLAPRSGRAAALVLVRARKGAGGPLRLLAPLVLHKGACHEHDGESYSAAVSAVLRDGAALKFPD